MKTRIFVKEQVLGTHNWLGAVKNVKFLENEHHHNFHFTLECDVKHDDREIEFIQLRTELINIISTKFKKEKGIYRFGPRSCEMIGKLIKNELERLFGNRNWKIIVSEDEIQGGIIL